MAKQVMHLGGRAIDVDVQGSGPLVVMVQGGAAPYRGYWETIVAQLRDSATVVTLDRPGVGTSPHTGASLSMADQTSHLAELILGLDGGPAVVVGHSLGGPVCIQLAADYSELVAGVVLLDPTPINLPAAARMLMVMTKIFGALGRSSTGRKVLAMPIVGGAKRYKDDPAALAQYTAMSQATIDDDQWGKCHRLLAGFGADSAQLWRRLENQPLKVPGVLVTADRKPSSALYKAHLAIAERTGLAFEVWPGTTHTCHLEEPGKVVTAVLSALQR